VQVILPAARFPLPGAAAKNGQPVVGRGAIFTRIGPDIPVGLGVMAILAAFLKPGVLNGGMAENLVNHDFQAQRVGLVQQAVKVRECPE